jgi:hypothetical protein
MVITPLTLILALIPDDDSATVEIPIGQALPPGAETLLLQHHIIENDSTMKFETCFGQLCSVFDGPGNTIKNLAVNLIFRANQYQSLDCDLEAWKAIFATKGIAFYSAFTVPPSAMGAPDREERERQYSPFLKVLAYLTY